MKVIYHFCKNYCLFWIHVTGIYQIFDLLRSSGSNSAFYLFHSQYPPSNVLLTKYVAFGNKTIISTTKQSLLPGIFAQVRVNNTCFLSSRNTQVLCRYFRFQAQCDPSVQIKKHLPVRHNKSDPESQLCSFKWLKNKHLKGEDFPIPRQK